MKLGHAASVAKPWMKGTVIRCGRQDRNGLFAMKKTDAV
jgi:hypothetical protein